MSFGLGKKVNEKNNGCRMVAQRLNSKPKKVVACRTMCVKLATQCGCYRQEKVRSLLDCAPRARISYSRVN